LTGRAEAHARGPRPDRAPPRKAPPGGRQAILDTPGSTDKQGSRLVRWAAVEAISRQRGGTHLQGDYRRIAERRNNRAIARVAVARKLLTLIYYGLRDGEIRCLNQAETG
jgi:hypothetical protein